MREIRFRVGGFVKAPRDVVYDVWSDLETLPKVFPAMFKTVRVVQRKGNTLVTEEVVETAGPRTRAVQQKKHIYYPQDRYEIEILTGKYQGTRRVTHFTDAPGGTAVYTNMHMRVNEELERELGADAHAKIKRVNEDWHAAMAHYCEARAPAPENRPAL